MSEKVSKNFFIDTNILVDYILLKEILKEEDKPNFPIYDSLEPSLKLIDFLINNKKIRWCTSFVNLCEMPSALIKDIVLSRMYIKRIPFQYFDKYYSNFIKQKNFKKQVENIVNKYYKFLTDNKIWFIDSMNITKKEDFQKIDDLKIDFRLPLGDSLIFFIAKKEGGFFVTSDMHHFKDVGKKYANEIEVISPKQALEKAKKLI